MPEKILKIPETRKVLFEKFNFDKAVEEIFVERLDGCEIIIKNGIEYYFIKNKNILLIGHSCRTEFYFKYKIMWELFDKLNDLENKYNDRNVLLHIVDRITTNLIQKNISAVCEKTTYLASSSMLDVEYDFFKNNLR